MADFKTCPGCPSPKACKGEKSALTETAVERQKAGGVNTSNAYY